MPGFLSWVTITIQQGGLTFRAYSDNDIRYTFQEADSNVGMTANDRFYENHSGPHGNPLSLGQSWTLQVRTDSSNDMGDSTAFVSVVVADSLETVTVPAGTFECYKAVGTVGSAGTITEWWDSTGTFDLAPVKMVDTANFNAPQTLELEECSFCGGGGDPPTTYNLNTASSAGGSVTDPGEGPQGPYDAGTVVNLVATADTGYDFDGWTGDVADPSAASTTITMDADYSVTANFVEEVVAPTQYSLTTASSAGGSVTDPATSSSGPYDAGTVVDLVATPDTGYMFSEWTGDTAGIADTNAASTTVTMNDDYSVTANFAELVLYDLTIASGDNGSVTDPGEGTFADKDGGTQVNLVATPDAGFMFSAWTGDTAGIADVNAASTTVTMNGDYSIMAEFTELVQYELMTANSGNGSVTTPGEGASNHDAGSVVNLVATPNAGYIFDRWTGDVGDIADPFAASTTITMNSDCSISADFVEAPEAWSCPMDQVALIAPYPGAGRAEIGSTVQISDISFSGDWFMILELDEGSGAWSTYYSGFTTGNTLTELEPGKYYYVVVSEPGSLYLR